MKMMHTKLPEFLSKMKHAAATGGDVPKEIDIRGMENLKTVKMQSLRTGRIEHAVEELAEDGSIARIEMVVMPRVPETMHTVVLRGVGEDGKCVRAILESVNIIHPTEEAELLDCEMVEDRRPPIGRH